MAKKNSIARPAPVRTVLIVSNGTDRKTKLRQRAGRAEISADQKIQPFPAPAWTPPAAARHALRRPRLKMTPPSGPVRVCGPVGSRERTE